jgi:Na+-translocating ferredoxin:NAD+ oxidoreductase RnfG subunit
MSCGNPSTKPPARRWKQRALACYRLGIILAALLCLRLLPSGSAAVDRATILAQAKAVLSSTTALGEAADDIIPLLDRDESIIGWATTTQPAAAKIIGYSGPSELLVIFDAERTVKAVRFLTSADTDGHVAKVRADADFWQQWTGKSEASLGAAGKPRIVSGATLTSEAMARGVAARFGAQGMDQWFPEPLTVQQVTHWFPKADRIAETDSAGTYQISLGESPLGTVLRSSRMGISARGFNGISDVILALDAKEQVVLGIRLLGSRDNEPYVGDVKNEVLYADGFAGKSVAEVLAGAPVESPFLFTSGASRTTQAVVESVAEMLRRHQAVRSRDAFPWKSALAFVWIGLGLFVGFHRKGSGKRMRLAFAIISVAAGVSLGWMVSQDQLIGWGANGLNVGLASPLLALTAVALLVPAFTGKNLYCSRICPHGAAQTLAGLAVRRRFSLPPKLHAIMARVPWLTLIVIWLLALLGSGLPLAFFEPFEVWSSGFIALIPAAIFTLGLLAAFFLPQAYCHYGCPTGALLKFLTHAPTRWTSRDTLAGLLAAVAALFVWIR